MQRVLIIGCGDIGQRVAAHLHGRYRLYALARTPVQQVRLQALGIQPVAGDLDDPASLHRLAGLADVVLHLAPPQASGRVDRRTRHLLAALGKSGILPQRLVYISTSGVYGDCQGAWVDETQPPQPANPRAHRRLSAERQLRAFARRTGVAVCILRVPGIYSPERLPQARLAAGTPAITAAEDSYSNHIHAEDLARAVLAALRRGRPGRIYHVADDAPLKMGDYFDLAAAYLRLPGPPRVSRREAQAMLSPVQLSFLNESRRLRNRRLKQELGVRLAYPDVQAALARLPDVTD